jgi:hypothetical protein
MRTPWIKRGSFHFVAAGPRRTSPTSPPGRSALADISRIPKLLVAIFRPWGVPRQRNSIAADSLTAKTARCSAPLGRNSLLCVHEGVPLPSSAVASDLISRSRWCGRHPQLGDQHQDFLGHLSRHRDLGHLKGRVAAVAHDLGADLDQLVAQAGQRPRLRRLRHRQRPHEIAEIVGQRVELEADGVGGEGSA